MDLAEFSSPPPKPWLVVQGANIAQQSSNGVSIVASPVGLTGTTLTDLTPSGAGLAGSVGCEEALCAPGMSYQIRAYLNLVVLANANIKLYLALDAAGTIPVTNSAAFNIGGSGGTFSTRFDFEVTFKAVGVAGVCTTVGYTFNVGTGATGTNLTNSSTALTTGGVQLHLIAQWSAGGSTVTLVNYTSARLY
jgi:hypothetical protein